MIYLGDTAHPFQTSPCWSAHAKVWGDQPLVLNFEGAFFDGPNVPLHGVGNHMSLVGLLEQHNCVAFLANNHFLDEPGSAIDTLATLSRIGVGCLGVGLNREAAQSAHVLEESGHTIVLLGFGWRTIGCRTRPAAGVHLNELSGPAAIDQVRRARSSYPDALIHVSLHWNYELELYPQPGHRRLAQELIRAGADAIIGHHPHLVGGMEWFDGKPVLYSLGNWWVPQGIFENGTVKYPDESYLQAALELRPGTKPRVHWFRYCPEQHSLKYEFSELVAESARLAERTPFSGFDDRAYLTWFRKNRRKRKLLPIVKHHASPWRDSAVELTVWLRHQALMCAEGLGLRRRRGM